MATIDSSTDSTGEFGDDNTLDHSYSELKDLSFSTANPNEILSINVSHNLLQELPDSIADFRNLVSLEITGNKLTSIPEALMFCCHLRTLTARNNILNEDSLPKNMSALHHLEVVNFSGNQFEKFPVQLTSCSNLKCIYMGGNRITHVTCQIGCLQRLEVLYLGGNRLEYIPAQIGLLLNLSALVLCDNNLKSIPDALGNLRRLRCLSLHSNDLQTLPSSIVSLNLMELSLRNNPLVEKFAHDLEFQPPTLLELAGRTIKVQDIPFGPDVLPQCMVDYLDSAASCVNPKCKGVYFKSCVETVKFVDFCGKFHLPLMQYLCSPRCNSNKTPLYPTPSSPTPNHKLQKVLLG